MLLCSSSMLSALWLCRPSVAHASSTTTSTLSLHDALPIFRHAPDEAKLFLGNRGAKRRHRMSKPRLGQRDHIQIALGQKDRKSTRLNSSHVAISYAVFCLKTKRHKVMTPKALQIATLEGST